MRPIACSRVMRLRTVLAMALVSCLHTVNAADTNPMPIKLDTGPIQGAIQDGVSYFKGIPFAAPPVGI